MEIISSVKGQGVKRDIELVLQTYNTCMQDGAGSYLAGPISTGRRYYDLLSIHKITTLEKLISHVGHNHYLELVRWPNVTEGEEIATRLRLKGVNNLINTGPLFVEEWHGNDYMDLCLKLIDQKVSTIYFHPDWAYSSGAVKEYLFCLQRGKVLLNIDGSNLMVEGAINAIEAVCDDLNLRGLPTTRHEGHLASIQQINEQMKFSVSR
jgi:hypothetical protein